MTKFQIELANKIRNGRCIGNEYVITGRPAGNSMILARFDSREEAVTYLATMLEIDAR